MHVDFKETGLQLKALIRICFLRPNSWREIVIGLIALAFAPLVILVCILSNTRDRSNQKGQENHGR